ncbi:MAG: type II toxin-antitoxin system VapC family toxin [Candidatus Cryptobacteroides sp.]
MQYLLDTNICVFFLRQKFGVGERMLQAGVSNCFISELTYAELLYGAECSDNPEKNKSLIARFLSRIRVIPIKDAIPLFAKEKARLRKDGTLVEDFDLLIGTTAVKEGLTMVTENTRHFQNIDGIQLDNWVVR